MTLKTILYRGGLVSFCIPKSWVEEYEADGGGTFYQDRADAGTLRLNVLTFKAPAAAELPSPQQVLLGSPRASLGQVTPLPGGKALLFARESLTEGGTRVSMYFWHIAQQVPPSHIRMAVFTYTVASDQESLPHIVTELSVLSRELPRAVLASELGLVTG